MADLQVTLALLLENQAELARELQKAGGQAGDQFGRGLSAEAQKAFDALVSQAEKAAKEAGVRFNRTKLQFETVRGEVIPPQTLDQLGKVNKGFAEARQAVDVFRAAVTQTGREASQSFNLLESAITGVAISLTSKLTDAAGSALGSVQGLVGGFLALDGELRLAAAAAGEQGGYERLGKIVDQVGIDAAGTAKQVAELATSLVRAGFSVSEVEGALAGVVRGAEATGTGFESFGNIVGNTLRGFGLEVDQTSRVVDVLTNTANSSNASIEGLGYTFEYTAPIAKALGVSLEDVAAAAGLMANAGIQGSVAGTGLRTGLQKLQQAAGGASPEVMGLMRGQERLAGVMRKLGATVIDTNGKLLPMEQVLLRLKGGLEKLNQADQVQLANVLFGDEAGSKFLAITNQSNAAISKMFADIRNSTGATNTARSAMAGMGLELQQLTGTMDSLRNNVGAVLAAGLRPLVQVANAVVGVISGLPAPVKATAGAVFALGVTVTGATVAIAALNVVVAQVGGWVALRTAVTGVAAVIAGPLGAGVAILLGMAAAAGVLFGAFRETDRTTRTLLQTVAGLGAAIAVLRLAAVLQAAWNARLRVTATLQAIIATLSGGNLAKGLLTAAAAAGVGIGAYLAMGAAIGVAGEETEGLADKARTMREEIAKLQKDIDEGKKLKVDTSDSERQLEILQLQLQEVERPLELKVDIEKAKAKAKEFKEQFGKLGDDDNRRGPIFAQLKAAERYQAFLEQLDKKQPVQGSPIVQQLARDLTTIQDRIRALMEKRMALPLTAKADRKQLDDEIDVMQQQFNLRKARVKIELNTEATRAQFNALMGDIAVAKSQGLDTTKMESDLLPMRNRLRILQLEREKNEKDLAATLDRTVQKEAERVATAKEQLTAARAKLEVEQAAASLADRTAGLEAARLRSVQQVADAYANLASAQAALVQSAFDVERSRNGQRLVLAEKELQFLRDRGANAQTLAAAEERITAIRRDGEAIDFRAMQATIEATTQRLEIERRVLELKQAAQLLEQRGAIRAAEQGVIAQQLQLNKLRTDALDPGLLPEQKAAIAEQVKLQEKGVALSRQQVAAERDRLQTLGVLFGLELQAQQAQQATVANQQRAAAAGRGWEETLNAALGRLDQAATGTSRLARDTETFYGTLQAGNGPAVAIVDTVRELPRPLGAALSLTQGLADGFNQANTQANALLQTAAKLAKAPTARWAGGDVMPGNAYQVNELGTESFLSRSGALSLIQAPAFGSWSPPSPGMVLPAGLTQQLESMGAFDGGITAPRLAGIGPAPSSGGSGAGRQVAALGRLQRSIDRLEGTMRSYSPTVTVTLPGNAGLLHTLQSFR